MLKINNIIFRFFILLAAIFLNMHCIYSSVFSDGSDESMSISSPGSFSRSSSSSCIPGSPTQFIHPSLYDWFEGRSSAGIFIKDTNEVLRGVVALESYQFTGVFYSLRESGLIRIAQRFQEQKIAQNWIIAMSLREKVTLKRR